jgi:hypothetical protein
MLFRILEKHDGTHEKSWNNVLDLNKNIETIPLRVLIRVNKREIGRYLFTVFISFTVTGSLREIFSSLAARSLNLIKNNFCWPPHFYTYSLFTRNRFEAWCIKF